MSVYILPLADPQAALETLGGKGMSLAKMARAGLPVPGGFHVTTQAYRRFVEGNAIQERILEALQDAGPEISADPARLEQLSQQIRAWFTGGVIPAEIAGEISAAYSALPASGPGESAPVAVRSSATAEDLPGASFAGQQDTYLNICGADAVLEAVKQCWASLWTARAIAYRARQGIEPGAVALAVVVQELVFAEAAGVLFTANPVSGSRAEMMVTATWGLGEAIVGGLVTPDTLVLDKATGQVLERATADKQVMTVRRAGGTAEQPVPTGRRSAPVLSDAQAAELAGFGRKIEALYDMPMDIEWTLAGGRFAIVQARPVTTLSAAAPAAPLVWASRTPKAMLARGSFAEFVPEPVSPLFGTLAVPIAEAQTQRMMGGIFGEQDSQSYVIEVINGYVYIGIVFSAKFYLRMLRASTLQAGKVLKTGMGRWAGARANLQAASAKWQRNLRQVRAPDLLAGVREIFTATAGYYTVAQSGPIPNAVSSEAVFSRFYQALVKRKSDPAPTVFLLGLDSQPLRAEKSLYDLALMAKQQGELADYLLRAPTAEISAALRGGAGPAELRGAFAEGLAAHLAQFGHALYDLDFAKPLPADDPAPVIDALKAYLAGQAGSPYERQRAQSERRAQAEQAIVARLDPLRRKWFGKLLGWAQKGSPGREDCIADLGLGHPQMRRLLLELGRRLVEGGAIAEPEDVFWLEAQEAGALAAALETGAALEPHAGQVERRKADWQRARGITPPTLLPEKKWIKRFLVHDNPSGSLLKGYAASAGKVTAPACVMRGPQDFALMQPGAVIVSVTTTPAWTPLFAMASAVVTDIGGPLSHSSIVAREYGIPAVMATEVASRRIRTGQMITVDGSAGTVTLIENGNGA